MAIHSSILAWKIPQTEEPGGLQSMGSQESDMTQQLNYNNENVIRNKIYAERTFSSNGEQIHLKLSSRS